MRKAFTLIEVLVVVIIIGILASIAIPQYTKTIQKAKTAEAMIALGSLRCAMDRYWYEHVAIGSYDQQLDNATFLFPEQGDIVLDISNPNRAPNRQWNYALWDSNSLDVKQYEIEARRLLPDGGQDDNVWVQMNQDGEIRKSIDGDNRFEDDIGEEEEEEE